MHLPSRACLVFAFAIALPLAAAERGAIFQRFDRDRNGKLTRDEIPRLFDRLDSDKDGGVTQEEAARFRSGATPAPTPAPEPGSGGMERSLDVRYARAPGVDSRFHSLDIYSPTGAKVAPVIVFIHGGGWRTGDKGNSAVGENPARFYTSEGFVFVSVNYRLTPGGRHPANIGDVAKAVAWVHDHIAGRGGDPGNMSVMGHSAGAHLASLVAADERWLKAEGKSLAIIRRAVLLDTAAYDIPRYMKEFADAREGAGMRALYENAFGTDDAAWRDASPQYHLAPGKCIPPMLLFYTGNRLSAQTLAPAYAKALTAVGAPSRAVDTVTLTHGEILAKASERGHPLAEVIVRFLGGEDVGTLPRRSSPAGLRGPREAGPGHARRCCAGWEGWL